MSPTWQHLSPKTQNLSPIDHRFYPLQSDYWYCRNTSENKNDNYYENLLLRVKKDYQLQQRDAASKRCVPCQKEHILVSKRVCFGYVLTYESMDHTLAAV